MSLTEFAHSNFILAGAQALGPVIIGSLSTAMLHFHHGHNRILLGANKQPMCALRPNTLNRLCVKISFTLRY